MKFLTKILLSLFVSIGSPVQAEVAYSTHIEVGLLAGNASEYARTGDGIGIIVVMGNNLRRAGYTHGKFGDAFQKLFQNSGVASRAFTAAVNQENTSVTFLTKNNSFGPYELQEAIDGIPSTVSEYLNEETVRSQN